MARIRSEGSRGRPLPYLLPLFLSTAFFAFSFFCLSFVVSLRPILGSFCPGVFLSPLSGSLFHFFSRAIFVVFSIFFATPPLHTKIAESKSGR